MLLEVKKLNKSFNQTKAVNDVSFSLSKGEILSIIGPSGSGKSTLLKLIGGLERLDSGDIYINNIHIGLKKEKID